MRETTISSVDDIARIGTDAPLLFTILGVINAGVALVNEDGHFLFVNEKYCNIYGFEHQELIGKHYLILVPKHEEAEYRAKFEVLAARKGKVTGETRLQRRDFTTIDIQFTSENIFSDKGKITILTVTDISDIKGIQQELNSNETKYRSMIENTAAQGEEIRRMIMNAALDAVICTDREGRIIFWNPRAEEVFGWTSAQVMGEKLFRTIKPEDLDPGIKSGIENYLSTGEANFINELMELTVVNNSGMRFPVELTIFPIKPMAQEEYFCVFIRDITERKKTEAEMIALNEKMAQSIDELAKSNTELEQFAYIASHDLQEPLRMVTNFLGQLEKKYGERFDERGLQYLHFAVDGAVRMRKIILDLLEYSRLGRIEHPMEKVDVKALVEELVSQERPESGKPTAQVSVGKLPTIVAHRTSIHQLFQNLISNAFKYQSPGNSPEVSIDCRETDRMWEFSVTDNGIGIDPRFFDKIFVIFQRLHSREEYSGTGIGLAICKKIVENHGGRIWVESQPGSGSTFYFTIEK